MHFVISAKALLDPTILFFLLGVGAGLIRSNLAIPSQMARFLALYLLMALGLKGGFALAHSGFESAVLVDLGLAILLAFMVPMAGYAVLRRFIPPLSAAAVAAAYGSVSAVTFITTVQYLDNQGVAYGGHMSAALALMESPAILFAVFMANLLRVRLPKKKGKAPVADSSLRHVLQESFTEGTQILLLGSMVVGYLTGEQGKSVMEPFTGDIFKGMLAFFLLDMGMATAAHFKDLKKVPKRLVVYGVIGPLVHALSALWLCSLFGVPMGNAVLLMVLAASASYIAVPAVIKHAIPEASPLLYLGMPLGLTFPLNILVGIPLYVALAQKFLR